VAYAYEALIQVFDVLCWWWCHSENRQ